MGEEERVAEAQPEEGEAAVEVEGAEHERRDLGLGADLQSVERVHEADRVRDEQREAPALLRRPVRRGQPRVEADPRRDDGEHGRHEVDRVEA